MEHIDPNLGAIALQTLVLLIGLGMVWGSLNATVKGHGVRLSKLETAVEQQTKTDVALARYEERYTALNQVVFQQGKRLDETTAQENSRMDSMSVLINGRMEAINNIVAGHTAQITQLLAKGRTT